MGSFGKWLIGFVIIAIIAAILSFVGPWNAQKKSEEMGQSVQSALNSAGFGDSIKTNMSGSVAKLSGSVGSEAKKAEAIEVAENAHCDNCPHGKPGKHWHKVDGSDITVKQMIPTVMPYTLTGQRSSDGNLTLKGFAHSEDERASILSAAQKAFPGKTIKSDIKIAAGSPENGWADVANTNIAALGQLESGEFSMSGSNSVLTGRSMSTDTRQAINDSIDQMPDGFNGAANIAVPNAVAANTGEIKDQNICQKLFEQLKGDEKINFAYNSDRITGADSIALLDTMSSAASQCSSFRIEVRGYTDSDGSEAYNLALSQRRAQAVANYLISKGVPADNVSGGGYGEASPVASNDTPEGKAMNRRIEFKVTQSN